MTCSFRIIQWHPCRPSSKKNFLKQGSGPMSWVSGLSVVGTVFISDAIYKIILPVILSWWRCQCITWCIIIRSVYCETPMPMQRPFFWKLWHWYLTWTLTDDPDFGTKERALPQAIYMWNMEVLSLNYHSKVMANVKVFADKRTNRPKTTCSPQFINAGA